MRSWELHLKKTVRILENSKVFDLADDLITAGVTVLLSDLLADPDEVQTVYGKELLKEESFEDLNALILAVPHNQYTLEFISGILKINGNKCFLFDLKSTMPREELQKHKLEVFRL